MDTVACADAYQTPAADEQEAYESRVASRPLRPRDAGADRPQVPTTAARPKRSSSVALLLRSEQATVARGSRSVVAPDRQQRSVER
jgi:hypothetical protein